VQAFVAGANGKLSSAVGEVSSGGAGPAHGTVLSTGEMAVFNYDSGNGRIIPIGADLKTFDNSHAVTITFPVPSDDISRPHEAVEHNGEVFVPDLGGDTVYRLSKNGTWKITGSIPQPVGSGPRHVAFYGEHFECSIILCLTCIVR